MYPSITGYKEPNYPDEKNQEYKWNYCKKSLKEDFGEAREENELRTIYEFNEGAILTG